MQARCWTHEFPGRSFPKDTGPWPKADVVQSYLQRYAADHNLAGKIIFGVKVRRLLPRNGGWSVTFHTPDNK